MNCSEICNRSVVVAHPSETVAEAVKLMDRHDVGTIVVVEGEAEHRKPVGIVTDRDIVLDVLAKDLRKDAISLGEIMSLDLVTARETDDVSTTLKHMRAGGVRRIPVVDDQGYLKGVISTSDVMETLAEGMMAIAKLHAPFSTHSIEGKGNCHE
mgnify:CR=1 FL=1